MRMRFVLFLLVPVSLAGAARAQTPRSTSARLPETIKLDSTFLAGLPVAKMASPFDDVDKALADTRTALDDLKAQRVPAVQAADGCRSKNFTQQDMANAGCVDSDTVAACSRKLYNQCTSMARLLYAAARSNFEQKSKTFADAAAKAAQIPNPAELK